MNPMNDFQKSLDRYLTSGPIDDGFDDWCETVGELIPEATYDDMEERGFWDGPVMDKWLEKTFQKKLEKYSEPNGETKVYGHLTPQMAANLITRAYHLLR